LDEQKKSRLLAGLTTNKFVEKRTIQENGDGINPSGKEMVNP
jgi:hypothetical protein